MYNVPRQFSAWIERFKGGFGPNMWFMGLQFTHWAVKDSDQKKAETMHVYSCSKKWNISGKQSQKSIELCALQVAEDDGRDEPSEPEILDFDSPQFDSPM